MKQRFAALITGSAVCLAPCIANAHLGMPGFGVANGTQEVTFSVGHGCAGADTYSVRIEIPAGVTSVRALTSDFGRATVERDAALNVTAVSWQKPLADLIDADDNYYKLVLRLKVPDKAFTKLPFLAHQTCRKADGSETTTHWVALDEAQGEPAPQLKILPARRSGWNKYTVPADVTLDAEALASFFDDAQIVWKDNQAYSANPATLDQIKATSGVEELTSLKAGDEIWVKY